MADLFSSNTLTTVVNSLIGVNQFLLDRFFPNIQTESTEEIHFDTVTGIRRISPFVSPLVEGQIVANPGFTTSTFKPAYIKDKRVFEMNIPFKRSPGEQIGGSLSPAERLRALIAQASQDQLNMLRRRLEVMAGELLTTGKSTISGEKYPTVVVDFGRPAGNTVVAAPLWSDPNAKPITDLNNWAMMVLQSSGAMLRDVVMTVDAFNAFSTNDQVKQMLNAWRAANVPASLNAALSTSEEGGVYMGTAGGFNIWAYSNWYIDPVDGVQKPVLPAGTVILSGPQLEGYQAYGAIRDEQAGLQAMPYYMKSWIQEDPSVRFIMLQSAPLLVPYRPAGMVKAKVL